MPFTHEQIKAMDQEAVEVELAIALFGFHWWSERGRTRYLINPVAYDKYAFKEYYLWDEATVGVPLATLPFSAVPHYATWDKIISVIAGMEARGWQWSAGWRAPGPRREPGGEAYAAFTMPRRDEQGLVCRSRVRAMGSPDYEGIPLATCQAALWTLQPWEGESDE